VQIETDFAVKAPANRVYEFLLDINSVVGCVPGAELSEVVDPDTFRGKVRIKVGPISVAYNGTAHITSRDPQQLAAVLAAEGRETAGSGSARSTTTMTVSEAGDGAAMVRFSTDLAVVGRVAQFGHGVLQDVAGKLVGQVAECIRARLEEEVAQTSGTETSGGEASPVVVLSPPETRPTELDAIALMSSVVRDRVQRLATPRNLTAGAGILALVIIVAGRVGRQ
jgi:uncharacterized protein